MLTPRFKKTLIISSSIITITLIGLGIFLRVNHVKLAQAKQNLIELPSATNPSNLAFNQYQAMIKGVTNQHPNSHFTLADSTQPIIQVVTITQNNQPPSPRPTPCHRRCHYPTHHSF